MITAWLAHEANLVKTRRPNDDELDLACLCVWWAEPMQINDQQSTAPKTNTMLPW